MKRKRAGGQVSSAQQMPQPLQVCPSAGLAGAFWWRWMVCSRISFLVATKAIQAHRRVDGWILIRFSDRKSQRIAAKFLASFGGFDFIGEFFNELDVAGA